MNAASPLYLVRVIRGSFFLIVIRSLEFVVVPN